MSPIRLDTKQSMKTLGRLMRQWTLDPSSRPEGTEDHPYCFVVSRDAFVSALVDEGLKEGVDFTLRDGIEEVELLTRREDRATLLLPEASAMKSIKAEGGTVKVRLASTGMYSEDFSIETLKQSGPVPFATTEPMYDLILAGDDPFDEFLDTYMGAYSVSQCR